jgi:hypothetical protein
LAGGEIAAFVELIDYDGGVLAERAVDFAVAGFVVAWKGFPGVVDDLPERGGSRAAGAVDGRHACSEIHARVRRNRIVSFEQLLRARI